MAFQTQAEDILTADDGVYNATFQYMEEVDGNFGKPMLKWVFDVQIGDKTHEMTAYSSTRFNPKTKAWGWYENISGKKLKPNDNISDAAIVQNKCQLVIKNTIGSKGDNFLKIAEILPAKTKGGK